MPLLNEEIDTILLVEDEDPVRRTFLEWLEGAGLKARVLAAADAESALIQANKNPIDLAILDWNLGAGNDGLKLLEDLAVFHPDIVAILVTGFAHQATPLHAMRMGVRDYLDKNQDLDRASFLKAVTRQLDHIRPAKRERRFHHTLLAFREAVEKVLPLVQSANALSDPVPLPGVAASLMRFLMETTAATDGVLLIRSFDGQRDPQEICRVYDARGAALSGSWVPFARSVAGTVSSLQEPYTINRLDEAARQGNLDLQPFENGLHTLLAAPLSIGPGMQGVLELFDKQEAKGDVRPSQFTESDKRLVSVAAPLGAAMLRQAVSERQTHQVLFDAIDAALKASDSLTESLKGSPGQRLQEPPPDSVLKQIREGLAGTGSQPQSTEELLELAEAIRVLALRHGPGGLTHCTRIVRSTRDLLDQVTGSGEGPIP
jgi:two-component system, NtrC family, nitrogen regulation response regulator NtrX